MSGEVNVIPTLRKFRGGPVEAFLGGASLEGGPVKKNPLYLLLNVYSPFSFLASGEEFAQTLEPPLLPLSRLFSAKSAAIREVD